MKYIVLAFSLLFATLTTAQSSQFESDLEKFIQMSNTADWKGMTDMMHPSIFQSITQEQMVAMMGQMKTMGLDIQMDLKEVTKVYDLIKSDGKSYQKLDYDVKVTIGMNDQLWQSKDFMLNGFKSSFGAENLEIDETNKSIVLDGVQTMVAIKDADDSNWKYMTFQNADDPLAKATLPAEVLGKISAQ